MLDGKVIVLTGGAKCIGLDRAQVMAGKGAIAWVLPPVPTAFCKTLSRNPLGRQSHPGVGLDCDNVDAGLALSTVGFAVANR